MHHPYICTCLLDKLQHFICWSNHIIHITINLHQQFMRPFSYCSPAHNTTGNTSSNYWHLGKILRHKVGYHSYAIIFLPNLSSNLYRLTLAIPIDSLFTFCWHRFPFAYSYRLIYLHPADIEFDLDFPVNYFIYIPLTSTSIDTFVSTHLFTFCIDSHGVVSHKNFAAMVTLRWRHDWI